MIFRHFFIKAVVLIILSSLLWSCSSPARVGEMIAREQYQQTLPKNFFLKNSIELRQVLGGQITRTFGESEVGNHEFREALIQSLVSHQLLAPNNKNGKYTLNVNLENVDQPAAGFSMTVNSKVRYQIVNSVSSEKIYDDLITASYTANFSDSYHGATRLQLANEGSIKKNIKTFIQKILLLRKN